MRPYVASGVIDSLHFARAALEQRGVLGLEQLQRLAKMQCSTQGLEYHLRGDRASNGERCLRLSVRGSVQVVCQRCLDPLPVPIAVDAELQLAENLREIAQADDEIDRVLAFPPHGRSGACRGRGYPGFADGAAA